MAVMSVALVARLRLAQILLRLLLEGRLAAGSAEVVGLSLVLESCRGLGWVNFHTTYWILCHLNTLHFFLVYLVFLLIPDPTDFGALHKVDDRRLLSFVQRLHL
jgi:hypothetical protein